VALFGCAATPPRATTPRRSEIVIDEETVVQVRAPGAPVTEGALPPLPQVSQHPSAAFQQGFVLAQALLRANGPSAPPDGDQSTYDAWLKAELAPWLEARGTALKAALRPLGEATSASPSEQVVAAALVGLVYARTQRQLLEVPPPPAVRTDEKLLHIYLDQVHQTSASWAKSAVDALRYCAAGAAAASAPAFRPWLDLCQSELAVLDQQAQQARALADTVTREREADREAEPPAAQEPQPVQEQPAP
jgi:hypothetical protein